MKFILLLGILGMPWMLLAQEEGAATGTRDAATALRNLYENREALNGQIHALRQREKQEKDAAQKEQLQEEAQALERRRQDLERDLMRVATGTDLREFDAGLEPEEDLTLQEEFGRLLTPVLSDLRNLTKRPRAIETLQQELAAQNYRYDRALQAMLEIDRVLLRLKDSTEPADISMMRYLTESRKEWESRRDEAEGRVLAAQYQLDELHKSGANFWGGLGEAAKRFVFTRGTNILLALLAFLVVLMGLRAAYFYTLKYVPVRKYQKLSFAARLMDVMHQVVSAGLAVAAGLAVLYARGDWLLGGLAVLTLVGILLAAKSGFASYLEQVRMLLNLGPVREGERVLVDGVPWKVGRIGLYTQLTNSVIGGGGLRLPLETLMEMTSRPCVKDEPWFPCKKGDWIFLDGTTQALVMHVAPDYVELDLRGGLRRWIPVGDFVKSDVMSLSGGYAVATTLGLDYRHQAEATKEIPERLREDVERGLLERVPKEHLRKVIVEFKMAAASSLDFLIIGLFTGEEAANYFGHERLLQRLAVESAQAHGWGIPFPQMVVHQAQA